MIHVVIGLSAYFMSIIVGRRFWVFYVLENIDKRLTQHRKLRKHASCYNLAPWLAFLGILYEVTRSELI